MKCGYCQKYSKFRFCSNECFSSSLGGNEKRACSICAPSNNGIRGNVRSNDICKECRKDPVNRGWATTPKQEVGGFELDEFESGSMPQSVDHTRYYTPLAREVLRLIHGGMSQMAAARAAGCTGRYVRYVVRYWRGQVGAVFFSTATKTTH